MNNPDRKTISAVIPTLNEQVTVAAVIQGCRPFVDEILVVDGNSTDRTVQVAREAGVDVILDNGKGKGAALRQGVERARGEIIVFIDADGSHDPADIPRLLEPILKGDADHVSGSRLIGGSSELHGGFDECFRLMGSSFITACINWRFKVRLSESQNGFRAIRAGVFRQLGLQDNTTTIEQEMIIKTLKRGFRMAEVPTHEHKRVAGDSKIVLRKVWFRYLISLIINLFFSIRQKI